MRDQFESDPRLKLHLDKTLERDHEVMEKKKEKEQIVRAQDKKRKEMEAKLFQDG